MLCSVNSAVNLCCRVRRIKCNIPIIPCSVYKGLYGQSRAFSEDFMYKVSTTVIKDKLTEVKSKFKDGYTCFNLKCNFCSKDKDSEERDDMGLFINKKTGNFLCHKCKMIGSWSAFNRILNIYQGKSQPDHFDHSIDCYSYDESDRWKMTIAKCNKLSDMDDKEYRTIMNHFNFCILPKDVINKLDIWVNEDRTVMYFPMIHNDISVGFISVKPNGDCVPYPKVDGSGYISIKNLESLSEVVVVADIRDFMALASVGIQNAVCLPYGVKVLSQNLLPYFESCEKVVLWLGSSYGSLSASVRYAKKLTERRCYLVRPNSGRESAAKALAAGEDPRRIVSEAKPIWHRFVTTFESLRADVTAEILNISEITGIAWSRFPMLNTILKGHRRGEVSVLTGPTGCGKTTFLSEYSLDLALQGVNTLWGSFEIKNSRLARTMLQQYSGMSFSTHNLDLFNIWADKFENLPIYFLTFHGQHSIKTVMGAVEHCAYTYDIGHVIIDNIQFMIDIGREDNYSNRFWIQDLILQTFRKFATANNCHVTLVIHPRKEADGSNLTINSVFGSAKATQEADNIMIMQNRAKMPQRKYLQIVKNRFTGDLGVMPLNFDKVSLSYTKKQDKCQNENSRYEQSFPDDIEFDEPDFETNH